MKILYFIFILLIGSYSVSAQIIPCELKSDFHGQSIIECSLVLVDEDFVLTPQQVLDSFKANKFIDPVALSKLYDGWERKPHWLIFRLEQTITDSLSLMIKFSDLRGVWTIELDRINPIEYMGYFPEYSESGITIFPENHRFLYKLPKTDTITFLCKTFPKYHERGPAFPYVINPSKYEQNKQSEISKETLLNGVIFGMMIMFFITSLIVFFLQREKAFLAYAIYIFLVFVYLWRDFEYLNFYFFSTMKYVPWHYTKLITTTVLGISYIYFIKNILNTPIDHPKVDKAMSILFLLLIIAIPIDYLGSEVLEIWSYRVAMYFVGIIILANQIFMNFCFFGSKDRIARYVALGSLFLAIGGISIPLFPVEVHTWIVRSCFIIEMFFFIAALMVKARRSIKQKYKMEEDIKKSELIHLYEMNTKVAIEKAITAENLRNEIAKDIHDEVGSDLTKISLASHLISTSINDQVTKLKIIKLGNDATKANKKLKELLFSINPNYDHFDIIQSYFRQYTVEYWESSDIKIDFEMRVSDINPKMDRYVKSQLMMVYKEIHQNIAKHADANLIQVKMYLTSQTDFIVSVEDNGKGFDPSCRSIHSNGIKNMKERCSKIGAEISFYSSVGKNTEVRIRGSLSGIR